MRLSMASAVLTLGIGMVGCGGSAFNSGGTGGTSGSSGTGGGDWGTGGWGTGGSSCGLVDCAYPVCPDGVAVETPPGQCCPVCACDQVACAPVECPVGVGTVLPFGECCPVCDTNVAPSCAGVACNPPPTTCPAGYEPGRAPGACCSGCVPTGETIIPPNCTTVDCASPVDCPLGYHLDTYASQCCAECVPDPGFCTSDTDCLMAADSLACCTCGEAISIRTYDEDPCWQSYTNPRTLPAECAPPPGCGATCGACAPPGVVQCAANHCTEVR